MDTQHKQLWFQCYQIMPKESKQEGLGFVIFKSKEFHRVCMCASSYNFGKTGWMKMWHLFSPTIFIVYYIFSHKMVTFHLRGMSCFHDDIFFIHLLWPPSRFCFLMAKHQEMQHELPTPSHFVCNSQCPKLWIRNF